MSPPVRTRPNCGEGLETAVDQNFKQRRCEENLSDPVILNLLPDLVQGEVSRRWDHRRTTR